jgi:hypothetical protein
MPVIVVGEEKTFAALRPRLFTGAKLSPAAARAATEAVAAANPHANLERLEPGTVLTVPDDVPKLSVSGNVSLDEPTRAAVAGLAATGKSTLEGLGAAARELQKQAVADRKALAKTLEAGELDSAARKDKVLRAALGAANEAMAQEDEAAKERAAALESARKAWATELDTLAKLLP